jgi:hypothetical protein
VIRGVDVEDGLVNSDQDAGTGSGSAGWKGKKRAIDGAADRDEDDLTILNKLELGPREFGVDPDGKEMWEKLEPNSGIRLKWVHAFLGTR